MRITKANVEALWDVLRDVVEDTGAEFGQQAEVWLDDEMDADERRDAREAIEGMMGELEGQLSDALRLIAA